MAMIDLDQVREQMGKIRALIDKPLPADKPGTTSIGPMLCGDAAVKVIAALELLASELIKTNDRLTQIERKT